MIMQKNRDRLSLKLLLVVTTLIIFGAFVDGQLQVLNSVKRSEISKSVKSNSKCQLSSKFYFTNPVNNYLLYQDARSDKVIAEADLGQTNCMVFCGHREDEVPYVGMFCENSSQVKVLQHSQHSQHSNIKKSTMLSKVILKKKQEISLLAIGGGNLAVVYFNLGVIDVFRIGHQQEHKSHPFNSNEFQVYVDGEGNLLIMTHDALYVCINPLGDCKMFVIDFYQIFIPNFSTYPGLDSYKSDKEGHRITYKLTLPRRNFRFHLLINNSLTKITQDPAYNLPGKIKSSPKYFVHYQSKTLNFYDEKFGKYLFQPHGIKLNEKVQGIQLAKGSNETKAYILTQNQLVTVGVEKNYDLQIFFGLLMGLGVLVLSYLIWTCLCECKKLDDQDQKFIELQNLSKNLTQQTRQSSGTIEEAISQQRPHS